MRFEERELKPYAEPVTPDTLKAGEVYFSVQFTDEDMLVPIMETWVFAGRNLDSEDVDVDRLYFQDVESYLQGIRYESAADENASFQVPSKNDINHIFDYERALDQLMKCSLRRRKVAG
jgi:hypothetical protein